MLSGFMVRLQQGCWFNFGEGQFYSERALRVGVLAETLRLFARYLLVLVLCSFFLLSFYRFHFYLDGLICRVETDHVSLNVAVLHAFGRGPFQFYVHYVPGVSLAY